MYAYSNVGSSDSLPFSISLVFGEKRAVTSSLSRSSVKEKTRFRDLNFSHSIPLLTRHDQTLPLAVLINSRVDPLNMIFPWLRTESIFVDAVISSVIWVESRTVLSRPISENKFRTRTLS